MTAEIGSVDRITSIIGERGTGKSTLALIDAVRFQNTTGALVIGHSPNGQIGDYPFIRFHKSLRALERAAGRKPAFMHFLVTGGQPEDVMVYARSVARAYRKRAIERAKHRWDEHKPAPRGVAATPVLCVIDEGTHLQRGHNNADLAELERALTSARHHHVAYTMLTQAPTARSWAFQEQANRFRVFRYLHEWGGNAIRAAGIPADELAPIRELPRFHYYHFDKESPQDAHYTAVDPADVEALRRRKIDDSWAFL